MGRVSVVRRSAFEWINGFWDTRRKRPKVCVLGFWLNCLPWVRVVRFGWLAGLYCSTLPAIACSGQPHKPHNRNRDKICMLRWFYRMRAVHILKVYFYLLVFAWISFPTIIHSHMGARLRIFAYVKRYPKPIRAAGKQLHTSKRYTCTSKCILGPRLCKLHCSIMQ